MKAERKYVRIYAVKTVSVFESYSKRVQEEKNKNYLVKEGKKNGKKNGKRMERNVPRKYAWYEEDSSESSDSNSSKLLQETTYVSESNSHPQPTSSVPQGTRRLSLVRFLLGVHNHMYAYFSLSKL